jgi:hypothetical protein
MQWLLVLSDREQDLRSQSQRITLEDFTLVIAKNPSLWDITSYKNSMA